MSRETADLSGSIADPKPLTFALLRQLSDGEFHSGEILAQHFAVSRASVHNALAKVAQYGLILHSIRGRGYRLLHAPDWLDADKVCASLPQCATPFHIQILDCATSSNTLLAQRAAQGAPHASVLAVEWQSSGRGRLGRVWHSGLGNALTFSVLWRFNCGLADLSGLSLAVGVALMRTLRDCGVQGAGLKWPNDILGASGKLAGILIEAQGDMLGPCAAVIGIGINLVLPEEITQRIDQPVSALSQLTDKLPARNTLLAELLQHLQQVMAEFGAAGFAGLREEWEGYHVFQNRPVKMLMPDGKEFSGIARGVSQDGALRVEMAGAQREIREFHAGEISLREADYAVV